MKKSGKRATRAVARQVREEGFEMLGSARKQVAPSLEKVSKLNAVPGAVGVARQVSEENYDKGRYDTEAEAKLEVLRRRLKQIQEEELLKARGARDERDRKWAQEQDEKMGKVPEGEQRKPDFTLPVGKKRVGFFRGRKAVAEKKTQRLETGRGIKN